MPRTIATPHRATLPDPQLLPSGSIIFNPTPMAVRGILGMFFGSMACNRRAWSAVVAHEHEWDCIGRSAVLWPLAVVLRAGGVTALEEEEEGAEMAAVVEEMVVVREGLRVRAARSLLGPPAAAERTPSLRPAWPPDSRSSSMSPWLTLVLKHRQQAMHAKKGTMVL